MDMYIYIFFLQISKNKLDKIIKYLHKYFLREVILKSLLVTLK